MHVGWMAVLDLPRGCAPRRCAAQGTDRRAPAPHAALSPAGGAGPDAGERAGVAGRAHFDLDRHVSTVGDESELDRAAMRAIADAFFSEQLDRARPLWHILVVPRLIGGGPRSWEGPSRDGGRHRRRGAGDAHVRRDPGAGAGRPGGLVPGAAVRTGAPRRGLPHRHRGGPVPDGAARGLARAVPAHTVRMADTLRRAAVSLADDALHPAEGCYLNDPIGPRRTLVTHRVRLSRMLDLKQRHGATLNDITLAVCAGTLRASPQSEATSRGTCA